MTHLFQAANPRYLHRLLLCSVWLAAFFLRIEANAKTDEGTLLGIDKQARVLTLTKGRPYVAYRYRDSMEVFLNGQPAKISSLVPGLHVRIDSFETGTANRIYAEGAVQQVKPRGAAEASTEGLINLNTASAELLDTLPGVGPVLAEAIMRGRPYATVNELQRVKGIGPQTLKKLAPFVRVN